MNHLLPQLPVQGQTSTGPSPDGATTTASPHSGHGGRVFETARALGCSPEDILDVSNNANSLAADLTASILADIPVEHRFYPDPQCTALRQAMARHEHVPASSVLPVHGSAEGIHLALLALQPTSVCIVGPTFSEYSRLCEAMGIAQTVHRLDPAADFTFTDADRQRLLASDAECLILCSPNNPTGHCISDLPGLLAQLAPKPVIVDLAYKEFLFGTAAFPEHAPAALLHANPHTLCLTSMTKFFFCPGIRLGAVVGTSALIERMAALQPPWSVTQLAQDAGVAFLERIEAYQSRLPALRTLSKEYATALRTLLGITRVIENEVNYLLVQLHDSSIAPALAAHLAQQRLLVRVCDTIPGMPPGYLRLQVRNATDNAHVLRLLREALEMWGAAPHPGRG